MNEANALPPCSSSSSGASTSRLCRSPGSNPPTLRHPIAAQLQYERVANAKLPCASERPEELVPCRAVDRTILPFRFNPSVWGRQGRALFTKSTACIDTETETWASIAHLLRVVVRAWYRAKHDREIWGTTPAEVQANIARRNLTVAHRGM